YWHLAVEPSSNAAAGAGVRLGGEGGRAAEYDRPSARREGMLPRTRRTGTDKRFDSGSPRPCPSVPSVAIIQDRKGRTGLLMAGIFSFWPWAVQRPLVSRAAFRSPRTTSTFARSGLG